jgi:hypothetical protein
VKHAGKCPNCGEPVSHFAAGCAICGADLLEHRRQLERRRVALPSAPTPLRTRLDAHAVLVIFTVLAILISPLLGLLLAGLGAQDRHRGGLIGQRNLFLWLAAVDVFLFFVPGFRFGILSLLFG